MTLEIKERFNHEYMDYEKISKVYGILTHNKLTSDDLKNVYKKFRTCQFCQIMTLSQQSNSELYSKIIDKSELLNL